MNKAVITACLLSMSLAPAFAQSSQGKAGSDNGPTSNSTTTNGAGPGAQSTEGGMTGGNASRSGTGMTTGAQRGNMSSEGHAGSGKSSEPRGR